MILLFSKYQKKSQLTTGRILPNLIQIENHTQNIDEKTHCAALVSTKPFSESLSKQISARRSDVPNRADHSNSTLEVALPYVNECVVDK